MLMQFWLATESISRQKLAYKNDRVRLVQHVLLTPCSRRKRGPTHVLLRASDLPKGSISVVAEEWARRVRGARLETLATEYYAGRGPAEAKAAAAEAGATLVFVSAGLGLVMASEPVPRYSLTTATGDPDGVGQRVAGEFSAEAWWEALRKTGLQSTNDLIEICTEAGGILVAALPGTYLRMVGAELAALPIDLLSRTRIVGAPSDAVPPPLRRLWMPYDERFNGADSPCPGTRGDFAQRAARHFVRAILSQDPSADAATHAAAVRRSLEVLSHPIKPSRRTGSDEELIDVISSLLPRTGGRSGRTLALLRREAGWACEQTRFRRLFAAAAATRVST